MTVRAPARCAGARTKRDTDVRPTSGGEIDPNNPQNALITDIKIAPTNADGNVVYQHNFYILRPLDPSKGNHKMMYEPPNRGGKTFATLNRSPVSGTLTNDPGALTDPTILANSFLWPQGYKMVFSGWENDLAALSSTTATAHFPVLTKTKTSFRPIRDYNGRRTGHAAGNTYKKYCGSRFRSNP